MEPHRGSKKRVAPKRKSSKSLQISGSSTKLHGFEATSPAAAARVVKSVASTAKPRGGKKLLVQNTASTSSKILTSRSEEKEARIEIRVEKSIKELIEKAAALLGQSISAFVVSKSVSDAQQVINDHSRTQVSLADWKRFQEILSNPPPPNEALKKAAKHYKEIVAHSDGF